nr:unnamed protein product [Digitaria exilis]
MAPGAPPPRRRRPAPAAGAGSVGSSVRVLLALAALYAALSVLAYRAIHMLHVTPLGADAPPGEFSEGRVLGHLHRLAVDIPGRQEGSPGLEAAAQYIKGELEGLAARAGPEYRIEVQETLVSGSFSMMFLRHRVTLGYRNHKNIVMRISSNVSEDDSPSLLVNGHFDSPFGSPGAADCGSCVASMLELSRLIIDSGWVPPRPVIFLFNGAEELFLLDMFGIIPGDTDYRIFAEDITNIPGLDIIFVLGGYFYHTSYDTLENLLPGSIQARGENLFNLVKAFTNSMLLKENDMSNSKDGIEDLRAVFFDYLTWFMVFYSRDVSLILHSLPIAIFFLAPLFLKFPNITFMSWSVTLLDLIRGKLLKSTLKNVTPCIWCYPCNIYPCWGCSIKIVIHKECNELVCSPLFGILYVCPCFTGWSVTAKDYMGISLVITWAIGANTLLGCFWVVFCNNYDVPFIVQSFVLQVYTLVGLSGGFLTFFISMSMLLGRLFSSIIKRQWSQQSPKSLAAYVVPMIPCLLYCLYYGGFLIQFLIEKTGMMGSLPKPYGYFVADIIVGAAVGLVVGWCFGPLVPVASRWLSKTSILQGLLQITVVALAIASQLFPYSTGAPKRVILQHTYVTGSLFLESQNKMMYANDIVDSNYGFSVLDANSVEFLLNNAPEAAKWLKDNSEFSFDEKHHSDRSFWVASYPVSFLFSGSLKFPAQTDEIRKHYHNFPQLLVQKTSRNNGQRRVHLNLSLGSLSEIWTAVLNVTGPLSDWSFADNILPAPETISGGPPSYVCRLSGKSDMDWSFWLEANSSESLRIDVAVLDHYLVDSTKELKRLFPSWADVIAFTSYFSTYYL